MHFTPCARAALAAAPFLPPLGTLRPVGAGLVPARGRPQGPPLLPGFRSRRAILRRLDVGAGAHTRPQGVRQKESPASGGTPGVGDSHIPEGGIFMANYTEHYQLHQWESEDSFLRTDFNADFAKIDGAIAACSHTVKGAYTGNGSYLTVELGFRPAAVLVSLGYQSYNQPRLSIDGDTAYMVMTDSGFRVQDDRNANLNEVGREYLYLAFQ